MLHIARKAFAPGADPVPGHARRHRASTSTSILAYRDRWIEKLGLQLVVASVEDAIQRGLGPGGAQRLAQPDPDAGAARGRREERLRRAVRRRAARRGEGPRQGARVLVPRRVRPVGPQEPAARDLEPLQRPRVPGPEHPRVPAVELDRARHLDLHRRGGHRDPRPLPRRRARGRRARRDAVRGQPVHPAPRRRDAAGRCASATAPSATRTSPLPSSRTPTPSRRSWPRSPPSGSPSAAPPAATTRSAKRPWKTARRRATSDGRRACSGFATAGSVDDGKSTLIGRLLYDSKSLFSDQLEAVEQVSRDRGNDYTDLALLTDGLRAEREQGITIDVAYRYFATPRRKFIIADTPGTSSTRATWSPAPRRPTSR